MKLFEFQTSKSVESWFSQDDTVMGGVSNSHLRFVAPGQVSFEGRVSQENSGGFAQVKYSKTSFDLSAYKGLELNLKGDNKSYQLRLNTTQEQVSYAQAFFAPDQWQTVRLDFAMFTASFRGRPLPDATALDPSNILAVGLMLGDKQAGHFCLTLANMSAYP